MPCLCSSYDDLRLAEAQKRRRADPSTSDAAWVRGRRVGRARPHSTRARVARGCSVCDRCARKDVTHAVGQAVLEVARERRRSTGGPSGFRHGWRIDAGYSLVRSMSTSWFASMRIAEQPRRPFTTASEMWPMSVTCPNASLPRRTRKPTGSAASCGVGKEIDVQAPNLDVVAPD